MLKRFAKRIGLRFNQTRSDRVANQAYSNYHNRIKKSFQKINFFNKGKKDY